MQNTRPIFNIQAPPARRRTTTPFKRRSPSKHQHRCHRAQHLQDPTGSLGEWAIPPNLNTQLVVLATSLNASFDNLAAITSNLNVQVQTNDQMPGQISRLVVDTDNLVQGLKKHWLLLGIFQKMNATNAPSSKAQNAPAKSESK